MANSSSQFNSVAQQPMLLGFNITADSDCSHVIKNHLLLERKAMTNLVSILKSSTPGFPVHHQLSELALTHVHWVGNAIQPSHPLSSCSPPAFSLSQHVSLFQWVSCSHQVAKVLEFQFQHQPFQWIFRKDYL